MRLLRCIHALLIYNSFLALFISIPTIMFINQFNFHHRTRILISMQISQVMYLISNLL